MRLATILRVHPAAWLCPALVVLSAVYAVAYQPAASEPYSVALTAGGSVVIGFLAPVCAALAAWEAGRLRRAGWWEMPHVRPPLAIAVLAMWPVIVSGLVAVSTSIIVQLVRAETLVPDLRILAVCVVVISAHALAGFAVGLKVPVVIAVPGVLIGSYLWMAFPRAMEPLWIRHLTGSLEACCLLQHDLAISAAIGAALVAGGLAIAAGIVIAAGWRIRPVGAALSALAVASFAGVSLVMGLGAEPAVARNPSELVCRSSQAVAVCVWPEHQGRIDEVLAIATTAAENWREAGIAIPTTFTEADGPLQAGERSFGFSEESTPTDILHSLAYALLPVWPACAEMGPYPGSAAIDPVHAWFDATAGMSARELTQRFPASTSPGRPSPTEIVAELMATSEQAQQEWLATNLAALERCDVEPELRPP